MASSITVTLASTSPPKRAAVAKFFNVPLASVNCVSCDSLNLPPQPINSGEQCAKARMEYLESLNLTSDYLVAIENEFCNGSDSREHEVCHVIAKEKSSGDIKSASATGCKFNRGVLKRAVDMAHQEGSPEYRFNGISVTVGSTVHSQWPTIPADDWIGNFNSRYLNREEQIHHALKRAFRNPVFVANILASKVTIIPDFPKPGVSFKDLSTLISDGDHFKALLKVIKFTVKEADPENFTKVVGLDARGFIYGPALAAAFKAGFVMARKAGKLPGDDLVSVQYTTEYSSETLQMRRDAINEDESVVVCDDLVATGGSLKAACDLVALAGGEVVACVVMLAVEPLLEQARALLGDIPLIVVLPECVAI